MSIIELVRGDIIAELKTIAVGNGCYRNTVHRVGRNIVEIDQVTKFPRVVAVLNEGRVDALDDAKKLVTEHVDVLVLGYVSASSISVNDSNDLIDNAESLIHDLKRCLIGLVSKYNNSKERRWIIEGKTGMFKIHRLLATADDRKGIVGVTFTAMVRYDQYTDCGAFIIDEDQTDTKVLGDD